VNFDDVVRVVLWVCAGGAFVAMVMSANRHGTRFWVLCALTILAVAAAANQDLAHDTTHTLLHR
jgi:hypothetical protein